MWSLDELDDATTNSIMADAQRSPESYVLKPQREGGGNNLYGAALKDRLSTGEGLSSFILMQRIMPPLNRCALQ